MPKLPESKLKKKTSLSLKVDSKVLEAVKSQCRERKLTLTQAVEYGLHAFLEVTMEVDILINPKKFL